MEKKKFLSRFKQAALFGDVKTSKSRQRLHEFLVLIRPITLGLQTGSLVLFIVTLWLTDSRYAYDIRDFGWVIALTLLSILLAARHLLLMSLFSMTTVWVLAIGFSMMGEYSPNRSFFAATLCITILLVMAPIFARTHQYIVTAIGVYLILGKGALIRPPERYDEGWLWMLMVSVFVLGNFLNLTVKKLHWESIKLREQLENAAFKDALTGIANRRKLLNDAQALHAAGKLNDGCFLMIDIDNFKQINDNFGHASGDEVLGKVGAALLDIVGSEPLGRLGGEEFGILLTNGSLERAQHVANDVLEAVRRIFIENHSVTVSIGISKVMPEGSLSDIIRAADSALYDAKRAGKDRFVVSGKDRLAFDRTEDRAA